MVDDFFDIDGLAKYLHLHPEQVQKMAERANSRGRRVANQEAIRQNGDFPLV